VLDSARVAIGAFPELSNSVVIVGQSQGAHAAISASLLAPAYATDVHAKGTVATGVPGDPPFAPATKAPQIPTPPHVGGAFATMNLLSLLAYRINKRADYPRGAPLAGVRAHLLAVAAQDLDNGLIGCQDAPRRSPFSWGNRIRAAALV
jgi:hypothetical protein